MSHVVGFRCRVDFGHPCRPKPYVQHTEGEGDVFVCGCLQVAYCCSVLAVVPLVTGDRYCLSLSELSLCRSFLLALHFCGFTT